MSIVLHPGFSTDLQGLTSDDLAGACGGFDFGQTLRAGNTGAVQGAQIGGVIGAGVGAVSGGVSGGTAGAAAASAGAAAE